MSDDSKPLPNPPPGTLPPITGTGPVKPLAPPSLPPVAEKGAIIIDARNAPSAPLPCGLKDPDAGQRIVELPADDSPSLDDAIAIDSAGDGTRQTSLGDVVDLVASHSAATIELWWGYSRSELLDDFDVQTDLNHAIRSADGLVLAFPGTDQDVYTYVVLPEDAGLASLNLVSGVGFVTAGYPHYPDEENGLTLLRLLIGGKPFRLYRSFYQVHGSYGLEIRCRLLRGQPITPR